MTSTTSASKFREDFNRLLRETNILFPSYPVKGCYPYLPYGAEIAERIRNIVEKELERHGHRRVLFPTLIPLSLFNREIDFFKGFSPEAYVVRSTLQGGEFDEPLILRPTSEVPLYYVFSHLIKSYRDLPIKVMQTVNVFRCETKMTGPLLRHREVMLFNEAHTFHRDREDAERQIREAIEVYKKILDELKIPYMIVKVPDWEVFPGSIETYDFVTVFPDGKILELASVINLGQKFSRAFDIKFQDRDGEIKYVWQTCYGIGIDRVLGAVLSLFMDDVGFCLPPRIAPYQYVIVPIPGERKESIVSRCHEVDSQLRAHGLRGFVDDSEDTPGSKFYRWERYGVPFRVEIGEREIRENRMTIAVRYLGRVKMSLEEFVKEISRLERSLEDALFRRAVERVSSMIGRDVSDEKPVYVLRAESERREQLEDLAGRVGRDLIGRIVYSNFMDGVEGMYLFGRKW